MDFDLNTLLDILRVVIGLIYLYLEYHAKRALWIFSALMPALGIVLFYNKGLYADCGMNVYYLLIAIYGWYVWSRRSGSKADDKPELKITHVKPRTLVPLVAVWLCVWALIAWILAEFTDSKVVVLDSLTTSMSIVGMWMLARKYAEEWLVWIVVDAIYVYLYFYKGIYFSGALYALYTIIAIQGYRKWSRMAAEVASAEDLTHHWRHSRQGTVAGRGNLPGQPSIKQQGVTSSAHNACLKRPATYDLRPTLRGGLKRPVRRGGVSRARRFGRRGYTRV